MAKTTLPKKQLELPIMLNLNGKTAGQLERRATPAVADFPPQSPVSKRVAEASALDLSVYDAISANYSQALK